MTNFNIAVLVSGNGSNLQSLIDFSKNKDSGFNISCVATNNPKAKALTRIKKTEISSICLNNKNFKNREEFDKEMINQLSEYDLDLIVLAGYMRILSESFINYYQGKIINLHPSLLPKYPGLNTHEKVFKNKDEFHGATVHLVDKGLDTGQIIGFSKFKVKNQMEVDDFAEEVHKIEHKLLPTIVSLIANNKLKIGVTNIELNNEIFENGKEFIF
tara:strand:+ start:16069 stop:16713 length:645 start_codon:yes stop_codon:yes gene_type:complete